MRQDLGLPQLFVTDVREDYDRVTFDAEPLEVSCPSCGEMEALSDPTFKPRVTIHDTPCRGKQASIHYLVLRYHCAPCHRYFDARAEGVNLKRRMTDRLVTYIENAAPRRTQQSIAEEVGVSVDRVRTLVNQLADRLADRHRFPTPRVLGLDDIKMNGRLYTMITNGETGHAIGLIEGCKADPIIKWISGNLDVARVQIVVSDLGLALLAARRAVLPHALHIADRWHLLQGCQKATAKVLNQEINRLSKSAPDQAATLRSFRRDLVGRRKRQRAPQWESLFEEKRLEPILRSHPRLSRAFYARIQLARVYECGGLGAAKTQMGRFYAAAAHPDIVAEFEDVVVRLKRHERLLWAYHIARGRYPDIAPGALTTSSTERRNGILRSAWKAARGVRRLNNLRLLALYQPWRFGADIVECAAPGCERIEGPAHLVAGLTGQRPGQPALGPAELRCSVHA